MRYPALLLLAVAAPAAAEVTTSEPHGLEVRESVQLNVPPAAAWAAFLRVGQWWSSEHSYSGDASNLSLDPKPGGCFCERVGDGGVEHMRVAVALPGKRLVMNGALGPLLYEAVAGVMDVKFDPSGTGTAVTLDYRASGFVHANGDKLAPVVDKVLADQMRRYQASVK